MQAQFAVAKTGRSYWVSGWWCASCHESRNNGAEQGFAAAACVVHELEEAEVERQLVLREAAVRAQPGAQQRPEALDGVDVDFAEAITVLVASIRAHRAIPLTDCCDCCERSPKE